MWSVDGDGVWVGGETRLDGAGVEGITSSSNEAVSSAAVWMATADEADGMAGSFSLLSAAPDWYTGGGEMWRY